MFHHDKVHGVPRQRIDALRTVPFFEGLPDRVLARVDHHVNEIEVPAGEVLMVEGAKPSSAFIIAEGVAEVRIDGVIRQAGAGELIGELALLQGAARSATVVARTPMRLFVMSSRDFGWVLDTAPLSERVLETVDRHLNGTEP